MIVKLNWDLWRISVILSYFCSEEKFPTPWPFGPFESFGPRKDPLESISSLVICLILWPFEPYGHNPTNRKLQKFSVYKLTWQLPSFITNRSSFITDLDFCESCFWPWHCCHLIYRLIKQIQKLKYKLKSLKNKLLEYKSTL